MKDITDKYYKHAQNILMDFELKSPVMIHMCEAIHY